ncbi:zinc ribbon domain-containing protein [Hydrogenophaga taeniospiralis]|uniref:FmdB family zinc ribbon protein n=1 Tax=Hydrogenophaga taeniospiralis TaxID=65656 RepID=UPI001CF93706|nr:FmdB family zinc ribbon protein [Hydrogenophaga taeniospiralis]MCB4364097.1 zinc ribbon domain-containing protein [Hydrogenophaga taeniospiralis]
MPIYAYKCASCGHAKDVLQKMSDDPLSICPACGQASFQKQLTAAGFQLKGSGWYVTDFRGGNGGTTAPAVAGAENGAGAADGAAKPASESTASPAAASPAAPAAAAPVASSPPTTST